MASSIPRQTFSKHDRIKTKVNKLFHGKRFCCICFKDKEDLRLWDTFYCVFNGSYRSERSLKDILGCTFGCKITTLLPTCYFCEDCIDIIIQAYQMLQEINFNHKILQYYTKKITEHIDRNTIKLADNVQSVAFSLDYPKISNQGQKNNKSLIPRNNTDYQKSNKILIDIKNQTDIKYASVIKNQNMIESDDDFQDRETLNEVSLDLNSIKKKNEPKEEKNPSQVREPNNILKKLRSTARKVTTVKLENKTRSLKSTNQTKKFKSVKSLMHLSKSIKAEKLRVKDKTMNKVEPLVKEELTKKSKDFKCYLCFTHFSDQNKLIEHSKHCFETVCESSMKPEENMTNEKEICDQCGKLVSSQYIQRHKKAHETQKQCPICSEFLNPVKYDKHLSLHEEPKRNFKSCANCEYETKYPELLDAHMNKEHLHIRPYKCEKCQKSFHSKLVWKEHIKIHDRRKTQQCDICGDRFAYKKSLVLHMRLHSGYTPYKCDLCEESFLSSSRRQTHKLTKHSGGPTFQCEICLRKYYRRSTMRKHQRTHDCKKLPKVKKVP